MITFRQFLAESAPSPSNVDGSYKVGDVLFDNRDGLGATPNNANVEYMGFVAWMKPSEFRKLCHSGDRGEDAGKLEKLMRAGQGIGAPFLSLDFKYSKTDDSLVQIKVNGHEGRARSDAFKAINGDVPMPVYMFVYGGVRARDIKQAELDHITRVGIVPEGESKTPHHVKIEKFFVAGKSIGG